MRAGYTAELATESGGTWSAAQPVPGLAGLVGGQQGSMLYSVSCPSSGNCTAAGEVDFDRGPLFVVDEKNGTWGSARELAGGNAYGVGGIYFDQTPLSCASAGNCAVARTVHGVGFLASEVNGTWNGEGDWGYPALNSVSGQVTSVSCASPGDCSAGGVIWLGSNIAPFLIDETNGTWATAAGVTGALTGSEIDAMSCASPDSCVAADSDGVSSVLTEKVPVAPTTTALSLSARSVPYGLEQLQKVSVTVSTASGVPTGTVVVKSATATVCAVTLSGGHGSCALPAARFAPGPVTLVAVYAGPPWYGASISPAASFAVAKAGTRTVLHLSEAKVRYGHEQAEKLWVTVTPIYAGTAAGKAAIKAGTTTVCVITLKAGKGSCALAARQLRTGTYRLVASYGGSADYTGSASAKATLTITK